MGLVGSVSVNAHGDSVFGKIRVPMGEAAASNSIGALSEAIPVKRLLFRETPSDYNFDWHRAPCRQFIINLNEPVKIQVTDGTTKVLEAGEVFYVEDVTGTGHWSRSVSEGVRRSVFIEVDDTFTPDRVE